MQTILNENTPVIRTPVPGGHHDVLIVAPDETIGFDEQDKLFTLAIGRDDDDQKFADVVREVWETLPDQCRNLMRSCWCGVPFPAGRPTEAGVVVHEDARRLRLNDFDDNEQRSRTFWVAMRRDPDSPEGNLDFDPARPVIASVSAAEHLPDLFGRDFGDFEGGRDFHVPNKWTGLVRAGLDEQDLEDAVISMFGHLYGRISTFELLCDMGSPHLDDEE